MPKILHARQFMTPDQSCHFASVSFHNTVRGYTHTHHDFQEFFWIDKGRACHWINGQQRDLHPGMVVALRADDAHDFTTEQNHRCLLSNFAFRCATWRTLCRRYGNEMSDPFAPKPIEQREFFLQGPQWLVLRRAVADIEAGSRSLLSTERFLLNLYSLLISSREPAQSAIPDWLASACRAITLPQHFRGGTRALVNLAGRSPEHVARAARRFLGQSPTDIVNAARLAYATAQLLESNDPILTIALDSGFPNLGHFYSLFKSHHHQSPAAYRKSHRGVIQPGG